MQVLLRIGCVSGKRLLRSFLIIGGPTVIDLLGYLEVTLCDKVQAIDFADTLLIDFLPTFEIYYIHILDDLLDSVWSEVGEYSEASKECDNFLKLSLFFLANGPDVIFSMQGRKAGLPTALNGGRASLIL